MRKVNVFLKLKSMIRHLTENKERKTTATKMVKIHDKYAPNWKIARLCDSI